MTKYRALRRITIHGGNPSGVPTIEDGFYVRTPRKGVSYEPGDLLGKVKPADVKQLLAEDAIEEVSE